MYRRAKVISNNDPDNMGKVKIYIPDYMTSESSAIWALPANTPYGGGNTDMGQGTPSFYAGSAMIPTPGQWVWIVFEKDNPNIPYYIGGLNIQNKPLSKETTDGGPKTALVYRSVTGKVYVASDSHTYKSSFMSGSKTDPTNSFGIDANQCVVALNDNPSGKVSFIQTDDGNYVKFAPGKNAYFRGGNSAVINTEKSMSQYNNNSVTTTNSLIISSLSGPNLTNVILKQGGNITNSNFGSAITQSPTSTSIKSISTTMSSSTITNVIGTLLSHNGSTGLPSFSMTVSTIVNSAKSGITNNLSNICQTNAQNSSGYSLSPSTFSNNVNQINQTNNNISNYINSSFNDLNNNIVNNTSQYLNDMGSSTSITPAMNDLQQSLNSNLIPLNNAIMQSISPNSNGTWVSVSNTSTNSTSSIPSTNSTTSTNSTSSIPSTNSTTSNIPDSWEWSPSYLSNTTSSFVEALTNIINDDLSNNLNNITEDVSQKLSGCPCEYSSLNTALLNSLNNQIQNTLYNNYNKISNLVNNSNINNYINSIVDNSIGKYSTNGNLLDDLETTLPSTDYTNLITILSENTTCNSTMYPYSEITTPSDIQIQTMWMYTFYLGRPADIYGLNYWDNYIQTNNNNTNLILSSISPGSIEIANSYVLNEFINNNNSILTDSTSTYGSQVTYVYNNLFNRDPQYTELYYWINEMSYNNVNSTNLLISILNNTTSNNDIQTMSNKLQTSINVSLALSPTLSTNNMICNALDNIANSSKTSSPFTNNITNYMTSPGLNSGIPPVKDINTALEWLYVSFPHSSNEPISSICKPYIYNGISPNLTENLSSSLADRIIKDIRSIVTQMILDPYTGLAPYLTIQTQLSTINLANTSITNQTQLNQVVSNVISNIQSNMNPYIANYIQVPVSDSTTSPSMQNYVYNSVLNPNQDLSSSINQMVNSNVSPNLVQSALSTTTAGNTVPISTVNYISNISNPNSTPQYIAINSQNNGCNYITNPMNNIFGYNVIQNPLGSLLNPFTNFINSLLSSLSNPFSMLMNDLLGSLFNTGNCSTDPLTNIANSFLSGGLGPIAGMFGGIVNQLTSPVSQLTNQTTNYINTNFGNSINIGSFINNGLTGLVNTSNNTILSSAIQVNPNIVSTTFTNTGLPGLVNTSNNTILSSAIQVNPNTVSTTFTNSAPNLVNPLSGFIGNNLITNLNSYVSSMSPGTPSNNWMQLLGGPSAIVNTGTSLLSGINNSVYSDAQNTINYMTNGSSPIGNVTTSLLGLPNNTSSMLSDYNSNSISQIPNQLYNVMYGNTSSFVSSLTNTNPITDFLSSTAPTATNNILNSSLTNLANSGTSILNNSISGLSQSVGLPTNLSSVLSSSLSSVVSNPTSLVNNFLSNSLSGSSSPFNVLGGLASANLSTGFTGMLNGLSSPSLASLATNGISSLISNGTNTISSIMPSLGNIGLSGSIGSTAMNTLNSVTGNALGNITNSVSSMASGVLGNATGSLNSLIGGSVGSLTSSLTNGATSALTSMVGNIGGLSSSLGSLTSNLGGSIVSSALSSCSSSSITIPYVGKIV